MRAYMGVGTTPPSLGFLLRNTEKGCSRKNHTETLSCPSPSWKATPPPASLCFSLLQGSQQHPSAHTH